MELPNFEVDGILCRVDRDIAIGHTGSAPFCYNGEVVIEETYTVLVSAILKDGGLNAKFLLSDGLAVIQEKFTLLLRAALPRWYMKRRLYYLPDYPSIA